MKRYKRYFKEASYSDDEYEPLFKAQSPGGKVWTKAFQSDVDKKYNSFTIHSDSSGSGADSFNSLKSKILSELIGTLLTDYGTNRKIEVDKIGITKDWRYFLSKIKNYAYLRKSPKGSDQRKFYYDLIYKIIRDLRKNPNDIKHSLDNSFKEIDAVITKQGW